MRTIITILILILIAAVAPHAPRANPASAQSVFASAYNTSTNGLVSWWKLESDSGGVAVDQVGNNDGTWEGGASSTDAAGFIGYGGEFDGTDDYVELPSELTDTLYPPGPYTVMGWAKPDVAYTDEPTPLISNRNTDAAGQYTVLGFHQGNVYGKIYGQNSEVTGDTAALGFGYEVGTWYHIAVAFSDTSDTYEVYINGERQINVVSGGVGGGLVDAVKIGSTPRGITGEYFDGKIDEVRIYDRALSAHEIRRLWKQGNVQSDEVNE